MHLNGFSQDFSKIIQYEWISVHYFHDKSLGVLKNIKSNYFESSTDVSCYVPVIGINIPIPFIL